MQLALEGPPQYGRRCNGQYVYAIVFSQPKPETIQQHGMKKPEDFTREAFGTLMVQAHDSCGVQLEETACFLEPHGNGQTHLNALVRSTTPYRWENVAKLLLEQHKVHVSFGSNVKTWADGVVYFRVASEHKPPQALDHHFTQWHRTMVHPTPLDQFLPERWRQQGFVRHTRMTHLAFYDACCQHNIKKETQLWATATRLSEQGDRALLAYCLDNECTGQLGKVLKAREGQEKARRATLTREALLQEYLEKNPCVCDNHGRCYSLCKHLLDMNGLNGQFQSQVLATMRTGRAKMRNVCLVGDANCGKSFLFNGLDEIFSVYDRPDGGTHQLENLLDAEVVFLNDFEYDSGAKDWMPWSYFKNFLEGRPVTVARPKTRGGNERFTADTPIFMTAPQEVTLMKYGKAVESETKQIRKRILYMPMHYNIPDGQREEVLRCCGHCSARLYLEGRQILDAPPQHALVPPAPPLGNELPQQNGEPRRKKQRTAEECIEELKDLKALMDHDLLTRQEFENLKGRLLSGH